MGLTRQLAFLGLVAVLLAVMARLEVARLFGAHPWWAESVVYIGMAIGFVPALVIRLRAAGRPLVIWLAVAALGVAALVTFVGKRLFVASYGDDGLAGALWYFGWIGSVAALFVVLAALGADRRT